MARSTWKATASQFINDVAPGLGESNWAGAAYMIDEQATVIHQIVLHYYQVANEFYRKFNKKLATPPFLLVTTVINKRIGGNLSLSSMSSPRVFFVNDVAPTLDYIAWLAANPHIAATVNATQVT
ncbi:hypothetical protein Bca4012_067292 [Brassica carinata]